VLLPVEDVVVSSGGGSGAGGFSSPWVSSVGRGVVVAGRLLSPEKLLPPTGPPSRRSQ
jgi:hypothetical protein